MSEPLSIKADKETQRKLLELLAKGIWMVKIKRPFIDSQREVVLYRDASEVREEFDPKPLLDAALDVLGDDWIFSFMGEIELYKNKGNLIGEMRFYRIETYSGSFDKKERDIRLPVARVSIFGSSYRDVLK